MRYAFFLGMLTIFLCIWGGLNFYIFLRIKVLFAGKFTLLFSIVFWLFAFSYIISRLIESLGVPSHIPIFIGGVLMGIQIYLFFGFIFSDFVYLLLKLFKVSYPISDYNTALITLCMAILVICFGFVNSLFPKTKYLKIPKPVGAESMRIAFVSDIHLGHVIGKKRAEKLASMIEMEKPDIILYGGDVVDEDVKIVIQKDMAQPLQNLHSRFGSFVVMGNHEYIGGVDHNEEYLSSRGMIVLRDSLVDIGSYLIAGREDVSARRFGKIARKPLVEILPETDKPVILIDHQPSRLKEAIDSNVFLQLSGHTHHGQMWPVNFITSMIFKISHGYEKIDGTHFYVSCGYGTWGPPIRIGSRPELMIIDLQ